MGEVSESVFEVQSTVGSNLWYTFGMGHFAGWNCEIQHISGYVFWGQLCAA